MESAGNPSYWAESQFFGIVDPLPKPDPGMGDVDRDVFVSMVDSRMVREYFEGKNVIGFHPEYADVNQDGQINMTDAHYIYRYVIGEEQSLPVPSPVPTPTPTATPLPTLVPYGTIFYDGFDNGLTQWDYASSAEILNIPDTLEPRAKLTGNGEIEARISTYGKDSLLVSFYMGYGKLEYGESITAAWSDGYTDHTIVSVKNTNPLAAIDGWKYYERTLPVEAANLDTFTLKFYLNSTPFSGYGLIDEVTLYADSMPTPTHAPATPTPTPNPAAVDLKAQYVSGNTVPATSRLNPVINLVNTSFSLLDMKDVIVRYYYSNESPQPQVQGFSVISAVIDPASIHGTFYNGYCELSFDESAGSLNPGAKTWEISFTIETTECNQENDWSYNPGFNVLTDWNHISVYYRGILKWGTGPPSIASLDCDITFPENCGYTALATPATQSRSAGNNS